MQNQIQVVSPFSGATAFESAQKMALSLSQSSMLPEQYRGPDKVGNILIALEVSQRIDCSLLTVTQNLHVIAGRPSWGAPFLIGSVNSSGRFTPLRFEYSGAAGTDARGCRAVAKDKSTGESCEGTVVTVAMAKAQGWWARGGSKWPHLTEQMLSYRAAAFWARLFCPEIGLGLPMSDEVEDTIGTDRSLPPEIRRVTPDPEPQPATITEVTVIPPSKHAVPDSPAPIDDPIAGLRAAATSHFKSRGIAWKQVKELAVKNQWWTAAETKKFADLNQEELEYIVSRIERIEKMLAKPGSSPAPGAAPSPEPDPAPAPAVVETPTSDEPPTTEEPA